MKDKEFPTPSTFYRNQRPEFFSDSKIVAKAILPREQLAYEISQISVNQKHDSFEILSRKLAEKLISPNLIPQVGPTGGGDGKTDSDTYPVSNFISDRWFINDNKWNENENWAFAFSAKTDWKPKVISDVKKIVETKRGYTKIFFFSNQKISSKNKKDTQDKVRNDYNIELIIIDAEWILEKVYSNNLLNDVIESLNLSRVYIEEKVIGPNDSERISNLSILEERINSTDRFLEIDFQLVEDCLESATTSRMLELPKAEVIGKFERAVKFANKLGNTQLTARVHYQYAWTLINWYDDYREFYTEYIIVKQLVTEEPNINNIELYLNLLNILHTVSNIDEAKDVLIIDSKQEEQEFISFLTKCSQNKDKPSTALLSKFHLSFYQIRNNIKNETLVSKELINLKEYFEISRPHLDIPFEQLKKITDIYGQLLPNNTEYDDLIDVVAEIEAVRFSELSSGQTYLKRGITKLKNNYNRESLIYFGKAARKLAKEETEFEFYYCLMFLSDAYSKLGLYWASYNALASASNIFANKWFTTGKLDPRFIRSVAGILKNEVIIGRLPIILCWYELYAVLKRYIQDDYNSTEHDKIPTDQLTDGCLATRLLNSSFEIFNKLTYLPDILSNNELWISGDAVLYLLGNEDLIELDEDKTELTKDKFSSFYNKAANQPFVEQMAYDTNLLDGNDISIETRILGTQIKINAKANTNLLILGETILAYLESYLATAFEDVFPLSEKISINISSENIETPFNLTIENKSDFHITIKEEYLLTRENKSDLMNAITSQLIARNYQFKDDYRTFLENLYKKDEVNERLSIIFEHYSFLTNILTQNPKFFLGDWKSDHVKNYELLRASSPIIIDEELRKLPKKEKDENKKT
ncbi:hypothetical protein HZP89_14065 [Elizabethkingia anophelis]|nr:hypothetical protein [Elizabethkingia anophelis]